MSQSKVLLVSTPFYRVLGSHINSMSLGISYIAAVLNEAGHDAWVYNADFARIDYYKLLRKVYDTFPSYIDIFQDEDHPIWTETVDSIVAFEPDWVGYSCYTANLSAVQVLSKQVRRRLPDCRQVVGGAHSTVDPKILEKLPDVDYATHREGEFVMLQLVDGGSPADIQGLSYRQDGQVRYNGSAPVIEPLDQLPYPEREKFWTHGGRPASPEDRAFMDVSFMISVRGCPFRCTFCASPSIWGRSIQQYRQPEELVKEITYVKERYWDIPDVDYAVLSQNSRDKNELLLDAVRIRDNTIVYFVDDVFTLRKKRTMELMQGMIDAGLNVPWKVESRADKIDQEIADKMAEAGCVRVKLGVESGSARMLKIMKKDETKEDIRKAVRCLKQAGVGITAHLLTGFPEETDEDLRETIDFARELDIDYYSLSILAPYYGSQIYFDVENQIDKQPWEYFFHHSKNLMVNNQLSESLLEEFWDLCDTKRYV